MNIDPRTVLLSPRSSESRIALTELMISFESKMPASALKILDIGIGGDPPPSANYFIFREKASEFHTMDFDPSWRPNFVHDITKRFDAAKDKSYDLVLLCETLEHIYDFKAALKEVCRISKAAIVTVPFVYPYHRSPDDYWRFTDVAMRRCLEDAGYPLVTSGFYCDGKSTWAMAANGETAAEKIGLAL